MMTGKAPYPVPDMTGEVFGRWTVLSRDGSNARGDSLWLCRCECGEERAVTGGSLRNGRSQSCGCLMRDVNGARARESAGLSKRPVTERFWDKVDLEGAGGCWLWTGAIGPDGYSQPFVVDGRGARAGKKPTRTAPHRFAWELLRGPIPEGMQIDHLCRVRNCVNPDHLEPVTAKTNTQRARAVARLEKE